MKPASYVAKSRIHAPPSNSALDFVALRSSRESIWNVRGLLRMLGARSAYETWRFTKVSGSTTEQPERVEGRQEPGDG